MITVPLNGHMLSISIIMNPANLKVKKRIINNVSKHLIIFQYFHDNTKSITALITTVFIAFCFVLHIFESYMSKMAQVKIFLVADMCLYSNFAAKLLW